MPAPVLTYSQWFAKHRTPSVPIKLDSVKQKTIQTNLERYDCEHPLQDEVIYQKHIQTIQNKYGVDNVGQIKKNANTNK